MQSIGALLTVLEENYEGDLTVNPLILPLEISTSVLYIYPMPSAR